MAKRKRRGTLGHATSEGVNALQRRMNRIAAVEGIALGAGKKRLADKEALRLEGMSMAGEELGIKCTCFHVAETLRQCACARNAQAMIAKRKSAQAEYKRMYAPR